MVCDLKHLPGSRDTVSHYIYALNRCFNPKLFILSLLSIVQGQSPLVTEG